MNPNANGKLITNCVYHINACALNAQHCFQDREDYDRFIDLIAYHQTSLPKPRFSDVLRQVKAGNMQNYIHNVLNGEGGSQHRIQIISYSVLPTHFNLVLKQLQDGGITGLMTSILNSYSKYYNSKYKRQGALFNGRFKKSILNTEDEIVNTTKKIHLDPVISGIVQDPAEWHAASCKEYLELKDERIWSLADHMGLMSQNKESYKQDLERGIKFILEIKNNQSICQNPDFGLGFKHWGKTE